MLFGATAGFVTQSGRTTAFIMASFVQAGLIAVERSMPIVLWANFGCSLVIFTAVFPIYLFALFLLAVAGVCIAFERPKPLLNSASATFGLALMLFGLQMMSASAPILTHLPAFVSVLAVIKSSLVLAFAMGLILTLLAQSHIAVTLIAITLVGQGVFDLEQTLMVILGAQAGSSAITYITGIHFRGEPRQVVAAQFLYSLFGLAIFVPVLLIAGAAVGGEAAFARLPARFHVSPGAAAAMATVVFNALTPLVLTLALPAYRRLCQRLAPPLETEDLGRPQFLSETVGGSAVASLLLAEQEQLRLLRRLPAYMGWIRGEPAVLAGPTPEAYSAAFVQVGKAIERFQAELTQRPMTAEDTEWLVGQQKRQELLATLDETCCALTEVAGELGGEASQLRTTIVEGLDTLLLTAISGMAGADDEELAMLETMTRDRGPAMERVRARYLSASDALSPETRARVLQVTSLFERAAWTLHRFTGLLRASPALAELPARRRPEAELAEAMPAAAKQAS
jgi:phosphate:Na+ symporter